MTLKKHRLLTLIYIEIKQQARLHRLFLIHNPLLFTKHPLFSFFHIYRKTFPQLSNSFTTYMEKGKYTI